VLWRCSISITLKYVLPFFPVYCANQFWRTEDVAAKTQNSRIDAPLIPEIEREGICMAPNHRLETLTWKLKRDKTKQKPTGGKKKISSRLRCNTGVLWRSAKMQPARNVYEWGLRAAGCGTFQLLITFTLRFYIFQMYLIPNLQSSFPSCSATIRSNQRASFAPQGNKKHGFERNELSEVPTESLK